jgi:serine phosphatase RsbU (regulator of sigma subunit)
LWIVRQNANDIEEIKGNKQAIGKTIEATPFTTHNIALQKGDSIYIFTDGFADQFGGEKGKKFMYKPLKKLLLELQYETASAQKDKLISTFEHWKGNLEQTDDICIIGVQI